MTKLPKTNANPMGSDDPKLRHIDNSDPKVHDFFGDDIFSTGFTAEQQRVGCPPLALLPLTTTPIPNDGTFGDFFLKSKVGEYDTRMLMQEFGLKGEVQYCNRTRQVDGKTFPTLLFVTPAATNKFHSWLRFVDALRYKMRRPQPFENFYIEVIAEELHRKLYLGPMDQEDPFNEAWNDRLEYPVLQILNEELYQLWSNMSINKASTKGFVRNEEGDSCHTEAPTWTLITFCVKYQVDEQQWLDAESRIKTLLVDAGFPEVEVSFVRAEVEPLDA